MANVIISPNMSLSIPIPGVDPGPDYALNLNASLSVIDSHNHSSGQGVQINPSGININSDLPFGNNNLTLARSIRFNPQSSALSLATDVGCIYESGVDLYYNDGAGNQIRLTQGGSIVGTAGSISGLPSGTASASYAAGTFVWQSATNTPATMDMGSAILRNNIANSKGLTLSPPNSLATNYTLTLPLIPAAISYLTIDTSGNITPLIAINNTVVSSSSGAYQNTTGGYVAVTNLTVTITSHGGPICIECIPDGTNSGSGSSYLSCVITGSPTSGTQANWQLQRGTTPIAEASLGINSVSSTSTPIEAQLYPPSCVKMIDVVAAGTYTYTLYMKNFSTSAADCVNVKLIAYEM